jgi:tetratricopeptide (TPR) repeat protein
MSNNCNTEKRIKARNNKVVLFERGAEFYFDLGYKYIQKGKLKTALRYIEKAVKIKPEDSFLQFNYAGILAELGDINRSTEVLCNIIEQLDPDYSECYYGLGCNFLQLQKIKKSVEYFSIYLEKDPEGEFAEEAEELLEMLTMIKDANNNLDDEELEKIYKIEEEAINHLEKREYDKAAQKFENVVQMLPNAVPARNNLSLAYYYLGYCYINMGLYIKAKLAWEKFLKMSRNPKDSKEIKSRLQQMEQPVKIEEGCNAVLSGRHELGIDILEPYLDSKFKDWWPLSYYLGVAYARTGNRKDAVASFKRVLGINGTHVESMEELAAIYGETNDKENETKYRKKAELIRAGGHKEKN